MAFFLFYFFGQLCYKVKVSGTYNREPPAYGYQEFIRYVYIVPDAEDVSITNSTRGINRNQNISARKTITISDFTSSNDFHFTAGQSIIIEPGTTIQNGYNFSAKIKPILQNACDPRTKSAVINNTVQTTQVKGITFLNTNNNKIDKTNIKDEEVSQIQKGIDVYPNPSSTVLNFRIGKNQQVRQIVIYTINGAMVKKIECIDSDLLTIDISGLNSGLHFIQIITDSGLLAKQFIKQ